MTKKTTATESAADVKATNATLAAKGGTSNRPKPKANKPAAAQSVTVQNVGLDLIDPNPDQHREIFDATALAELADSIAENGLLQPVTVRPIGKRFELVCGERRFRAHQILAESGRLDKAEIPALVKDMTESERGVATIIENIQRTDVTAMEEAEGYKTLLDRGMTIDEIAKACGLVKFRVEWRVRLLNLAGPVRIMFEAGQIDKQQALEIARLESEADQFRVVRAINSGNVSGWKAVQAAVNNILTPQADIAPMLDAPAPTSAEVKTATGMETRIERVAGILAKGWDEGECVIATRVNPDSAAKVADQLAAIKKMVATMERDLRNVIAARATAEPDPAPALDLETAAA